MAESSSQMDRLREYAMSFDGLLSLIPAKIYYGEDNSDQWKKKKQTKEQATVARRAKLDPNSVKSAKDVMEEQAKKRKLSEVEESDGESNVEGVEKELPRQGLKLHTNKKQKTDLSTSAQDPKPDSFAQVDDDNHEEERSKNAAQKKLKQERKKEKLAKKLEKQKAKKAKVVEKRLHLDGIEEADPQERSEDVGVIEPKAVAPDEENTPADSLEKMDLEGIVEEEEVQKSTASPSPEIHSPIFDNPTAPSTTTSTSSTIPPATAPKHIKIPTDPELLKARLAARIETLRAARKADGPNGAPARNRQELMEARRKKEEQRRAHKKELRLKAKVEEEARREEALVSARDSPASSMMSPALHTASEHNFSFGRVAFLDGQSLTADLSGLRDAPKRKGPQDPATALQASEKKRLRLAGLDESKRADIEEKDLWLNAKKRAHGEKVRDDTNLLKKTLKRKEKTKKKSEKEWNERKEGVAKGQAIRQKKREDNLRKRKEEKGTKSKGKSGGSQGKKPKVKSRPGFEGSFASGGRKR